MTGLSSKRICWSDLHHYARDYSPWLHGPWGILSLAIGLDRDDFLAGPLVTATNGAGWHPPPNAIWADCSQFGSTTLKRIKAHKLIWKCCVAAYAAANGVEWGTLPIPHVEWDVVPLSMGDQRVDSARVVDTLATLFKVHHYVSIL
jgi:hypothetical protein